MMEFEARSGDLQISKPKREVNIESVIKTHRLIGLHEIFERIVDCSDKICEDISKQDYLSNLCDTIFEFSRHSLENNSHGDVRPLACLVQKPLI